MGLSSFVAHAATSEAPPAASVSVAASAHVDGAGSLIVLNEEKTLNFIGGPNEPKEAMHEARIDSLPEAVAGFKAGDFIVVEVDGDRTPIRVTEITNENVLGVIQFTTELDQDAADAESAAEEKSKDPILMAPKVDPRRSDNVVDLTDAFEEQYNDVREKQALEVDVTANA